MQVCVCVRACCTCRVCNMCVLVVWFVADSYRHSIGKRWCCQLYRIHYISDVYMNSMVRKGERKKSYASGAHWLARERIVCCVKSIPHICGHILHKCKWHIAVRSWRLYYSLTLHKSQLVWLVSSYCHCCGYCYGCEPLFATWRLFLGNLFAHTWSICNTYCVRLIFVKRKGEK